MLQLMFITVLAMALIWTSVLIVTVAVCMAASRGDDASRTLSRREPERFIRPDAATWGREHHERARVAAARPARRRFPAQACDARELAARECRRELAKDAPSAVDSSPRRPAEIAGQELGALEGDSGSSEPRRMG